MANPGIGRTIRGPHATTFHTSAIVIAILSGSYALAALLLGSPFEFGVALALCGACWVAAHYIEWSVESAERERAARRRAVLRRQRRSSAPTSLHLSATISAC